VLAGVAMGSALTWSMAFVGCSERPEVPIPDGGSGSSTSTGEGATGTGGAATGTGGAATGTGGAATGTGGAATGTGGAATGSGGALADAGLVELTLQEEVVSKTQSPLPMVPPDPTNAYADNPTAATLGQRFYFDKAFAGPIAYTPNDLGAAGETGKVSCASCHVTPWGTDTRSYPNNYSLGTGWSTRNSPPIANVGFYAWYYWDGRSDSLWQQALLAGENALQQASDRLRIAHVVYTKYKADYEGVFGAAFGPLDARFDPADPSAFPPTGKPKSGAAAADGAWEAIPAADQAIITRVFVNWGKAIAAYERRVVSRNAPWDKFVAGDKAAISQDAVRGYKLFVGKAYCVNCHSGPLFSDSKLHNIGVPSHGGVVDRGRYDTIVKAIGNKFRGDGAWSDDVAAGAARIATQPDYVPPDGGVPPDSDLGLFRTKHLRQISKTGPYMHNGSFQTLEDVMTLYNAGGGDAGVGVLDKAFNAHVPLSADELTWVVEFMKTLTGDLPDPALLQDTSAP
jgi:cytochrome c peroxidase